MLRADQILTKVENVWTPFIHGPLYALLPSESHFFNQMFEMGYTLLLLVIPFRL